MDYICISILMLQLIILGLLSYDIFRNKLARAFLILLILLTIWISIFILFGINLITYSLFLISFLSILFLLYYLRLIGLEILIILSSLLLISYLIFYLYTLSPYFIYKSAYFYQQLVPSISISPIY